MIASIFLMTGCGVSNTAKDVNDITFNAALIRVCDPFAMLAAQRNMTEDTYAALQLLCEEMRYGYRP